MSFSIGGAEESFFHGWEAGSNLLMDLIPLTYLSATHSSKQFNEAGSIHIVRMSRF